MNSKGEKKLEVFHITEVDKIDSVISVFRDCDFFEFLKDEETRRAYAKKLAENSYFTVAYCEGEVMGGLSMYMNDKESGYVYTTFLAVKSVQAYWVP